MRLSPLLLVCLAAAGPAWGWGEAGHRIVGELAERQLTPAARKEVARLLREEPVPTLAGVAYWADEVRKREDYAHTRRWHYVNLPDWGCDYREGRDCPGGNCVVGVVARFAKTVGNPGYTRQQRAEALKFLIHFVGDIHQPLHAGLGSDRGGNLVRVRHGDEPWDLHSVWDRLILRSAGRDWRTYAAVLAARPPLAPEPSPDGVARSRDWAMESCRAITERALYPDAGSPRIDQSYLERHRPFAEERLRRAADRLAALLNAALDP